MKQFTHEEYEALEGAIRNGQRIAVQRRGTEYVVVPRELHTSGSREAVDAIHPTTGETIELYLDELDSFEVVA